MTIFYFGERWDSPMLDVPDDNSPPPVHCPTPVGQACVFCNYSIIDGDRGTFFAVLDGSTAHGGTTKPAHIECEWLHTIGHIHKVCTCTGWDTTTREARAEMLARINKARQTQGHGPIW